MVVVKGKSVCKIIDVAKPAGDCTVTPKEREKIEKDQKISSVLIATIWAMGKVEALPVVVRTFGTISKCLDKGKRKLV